MKDLLPSSPVGFELPHHTICLGLRIKNLGVILKHSAAEPLSWFAIVEGHFNAVSPGAAAPSFCPEDVAFHSQLGSRDDAERLRARFSAGVPFGVPGRLDLEDSTGAN